MATFARRRTAAALLIAALVGGIGASDALAQEYDGSTVTSSGGTTGVDVGDVLVLAPGVTINDGDVSNETGIGVVISGGTSAGASPGGGSNASVDE
jgi:hypothetical protein